MNTKTHLSLILFAVLSATLTACGGGGGGSATQPTLEPPVEPPPEPPAPPPKISGLLKTAESDEALAAALREGMRQNRQVSSPLSFVDFSPAPSTPEGDVAADFEDFSTTTLQEAGVDEADRVKYDGEILYVADYIPSSFTQPPPTDDFTDLLPRPSAYRPVITLYRTDSATASAQSVGRIEYPEGEAQLQLMLRMTEQSKQLISISENYSIPHLGLLADFSYWQSLSTQVKAWIVDNPQAPVEQFSIDIEGALLVSRRVGNILYVITRFSPVVDGLIQYPATEADKSANDTLLASVQATDFLPEVSRNQLPPEPLFTGSSCYIPNNDYEGIEPLSPSGSIVTVTAIDLSAPDNIRSICLNGFSSGHYVSTQSLYLTSSTANDKTLIHKIALNDGQPEYRGSGLVVGYLGTHNPSFMMSEVGDDLRVVSSTWENRFFPLPLMAVDLPDFEQEAQEEELRGRHHLTILRENTSEAYLEQIARLPNAAHPAHIGKPGEDLFAARFFGDRAYVVTFQTIDPLYVIDLSNSEDPKIEGELEIPGFSTYLQPLSANLLLGVGSEVSVDVPLVQGVKVALFDVGDAQNPVELGTAVIGKRGSHSAALYDHHALTLLQTDDEFRLALPIDRHDFLFSGDDPSDPRNYHGWSDSSLYQFSIDPAAGSLTQVGKLVSELRSDDQDYPQRPLHESRSVIHNDAVYLVIPGSDEVLSGSWGE